MLTCSLRVIGHALLGCAGACNTRISKGVSFLRFAPRCTVLRPRWCQSGVNVTQFQPNLYALEHMRRGYVQGRLPTIPLPRARSGCCRL
jgi:hypothetical protein